ncbi:uncharacterized protein LOC135922765 isoform X2 [Gordionus sp. m RMFG-2023]|uniref:uncharacterized protein LOC135922765 isoform X2 n=1 Tax=Gordionus sp. m RMFG-2023 TaxID=3053472 RepID=UPI0031FC583E
MLTLTEFDNLEYSPIYPGGKRDLDVLWIDAYLVLDKALATLSCLIDSAYQDPIDKFNQRIRKNCSPSSKLFHLTASHAKNIPGPNCQPRNWAGLKGQNTSSLSTGTGFNGLWGLTTLPEDRILEQREDLHQVKLYRSCPFTRAPLTRYGSECIGFDTHSIRRPLFSSYLALYQEENNCNETKEEIVTEPPNNLQSGSQFGHRRGSLPIVNSLQFNEEMDPKKKLFSQQSSYMNQSNLSLSNVLNGLFRVKSIKNNLKRTKSVIKLDNRKRKSANESDFKNLNTLELSSRQEELKTPLKNGFVSLFLPPHSPCISKHARSSKYIHTEANRENSDYEPNFNNLNNSSLTSTVAHSKINGNFTNFSPCSSDDFYSSSDPRYSKKSSYNSIVNNNPEIFRENSVNHSGYKNLKIFSNSRSKLASNSKIYPENNINMIENRASDKNCTNSFFPQKSIMNAQNTPNLHANKPNPHFNKTLLNRDSLTLATHHTLDLNLPGITLTPTHKSVFKQTHCLRVSTPVATSTSNTLGSTPSRTENYYSFSTTEEYVRWIESIREAINPYHSSVRRRENCLQIWILEAKGVPAKKGYFCEIYLDEHFHSRTATKTKAEICFWGETFDFKNLPDVQNVFVKFYRDDSSSSGPTKKNRKPKSKKDCNKARFIGNVSIPADLIKGNQFFEKWYPVTTPGQHSSHKSQSSSCDKPSIRIKARYQTFDILPLCLYKDFLNLLTEDYLIICQYLEAHISVKTKEDISTSLVYIFENFGMAQEFLTNIVEMEVNKLENESLTFRGNSLATKSIEAYMKFSGLSYLRRTLLDFINVILESNDDCEVDPTRVANKTALYKNQQNLTMYCEMAWTKIVNSYSYFPNPLKKVFHSIRKRLEASSHKPEISDNVISASIFLRFLCPAILSPSLFGLVQEYPQERAARNLTLIAKTIQTLANSNKFGGKEGYMNFMNHFVEREWINMKCFLRKISTVDSYDSSSFRTDKSEQNCLTLRFPEFEDYNERMDESCNSYYNNSSYNLSGIDLGKELSLTYSRLIETMDKMDTIYEGKDSFTHINSKLRKVIVDIRNASFSSCSDDASSIAELHRQIQLQQKSVISDEEYNIKNQLPYLDAPLSLSAFDRLHVTGVNSHSFQNQVTTNFKIHFNCHSPKSKELFENRCNTFEKNSKNNHVRSVSTSVFEEYRYNNYTDSQGSMNQNGISDHSAKSVKEHQYGKGTNGWAPLVYFDEELEADMMEQIETQHHANFNKEDTSGCDNLTNASFDDSGCCRTKNNECISNGKCDGIETETEEPMLLLQREEDEWDEEKRSQISVGMASSGYHTLNKPSSSFKSNSLPTSNEILSDDDCHCKDATVMNNELFDNFKIRHETDISYEINSDDKRNKYCVDDQYAFDDVKSTDKVIENNSKIVSNYEVHDLGNQLIKAYHDASLDDMIKNKEVNVSNGNFIQSNPVSDIGIKPRRHFRNARLRNSGNVIKTTDLTPMVNSKRCMKDSKSPYEYEMEINSLRLQLELINKKLVDAETKFYKGFHKNHEVAPIIHCPLVMHETNYDLKINIPNGDVASHKKEKDQQIDIILQKLLMLEKELKIEQKDVQSKVNDKQRIIEAQERKIQKLDKTNEKLLSALGKLNGLKINDNSIELPAKIT